MDIFRLTGVVDLKIDEFKAKAKEFETSIQKLEDKILELRKAKLIDGATKDDLIEYNKAIRETSVQLKEQRTDYARLKTDVNRYTVSTREATKAQTQFRSQVGATNSVALEFNRVIQDAPFGLIGIGNNLQQLTANFSQVRASAGSTGQALSQVFTSIISPANLLLLGVSAVTAGFTAYQLGAFDTLFANEDLAVSFKELASASQSATANSSVELIKINALRSVIEDETVARDKRIDAIKRLQNEYPEIFGNANQELLLNGSLTKSYELLTKAVIQRAEASIAEKQIENLVRQKELVDAQLKAKQAILATEKTILATLEKGAAPSGLSVATGVAGAGGAGVDNFAIQEKKIRDIESAVTDLSTRSAGLRINIEGFTESIVSYSQQFEGLLNPVKENLGKVSEDSELIDQAWKRFEETTQRLNPKLQEIADKFSVIGGTLPTQPPVTETADEAPLGIVQSLQDQIDMFKKLRDAQTDISGFNKYNEQVNNLDAQLKNLLGTGQQVQKIFATEALGGNPFSFLVDSIFKLRETNAEMDSFAANAEEKMALLREQTLLLGNVFSALGDTIASTFFQGNREMARFVSALGDFAGQALIVAQNYSKAKSIEASASAVAGAAQSAQSTGPAAIFTLAPFIASALALVSSAFGAFGGQKAGGGGFAGASASASSNAMGRSFSASGLGFTGFGGFELTSKVSGTDIKLVLSRAEKANA